MKSPVTTSEGHAIAFAIPTKKGKFAKNTLPMDFQSIRQEQ